MAQSIKLRINQIKKLLFFLVIGGFTFGIILWLFQKWELHDLIEKVPFNRELKIFLVERLVKLDTSPFALNESSQELEGVIYVMGGSQKNLKYRFKTAAELYHKGIAKKLMILDEPGITEYDPQIGRNLTNNEWCIRELVNSGFGKGDIEFMVMERGFLGTMREAKAVSTIALERDYKRLVLVSSSYHTKRVWVTFSRILMYNNLFLDIYSSNEDTDLRNLLFEYVKLISYEYIILPIYLKLPG